MHLSVLGPLRVTVRGAAADPGGPRQRAVLARLAVAGGAVVSADRLVDDLWGDADVPAKALATLQVHVSHLRRVLEPGRAPRTVATVLVSAPPGYALRLPAGAVDAWHFDDLVRRAAGAGPADQERLLTEALGCWQGDAYAEVAAEPWAVPEVNRLSELRLHAVEALAEARLALGGAALVTAELERHLHDNPGREAAVRLLALALYRTGRQGDALAVLRRTREHLADELGVDPGPALRALEADILAQSPSLEAGIFAQSPSLEASVLARSPSLEAGVLARSAAVGAATPAAVTVAQPATATMGRDTEPAPAATGRDAELAAIAAAAEEAAREGARVVLIGGDAGAGKTTLAEAALAALERTGWRVRRGRCPEVEGAPPGWAWSEALGSDAALDGSPNPFQLGRTIATALDTGRGAVLLDDVHRADDLTLQLLRQVVAQQAGRPLLVLVTYRTTDRGDELEATIAALLGSTAAHLVLRGLDPEAVAELARRHGLAEAGPELLAMVAERTNGNPLFVRELARLIAAEGSRAAGSGVPAGVREVLRRRVARLPDAVATTLRQLAVLGREADLDVLAEVAGRDPDDLLDTLETAVLAGLLDEPAPGQVRFTHALVRDTLYEDTPLLRRARLHTRALTVLDGHADAATLARHAAAAAGPATAGEAVPYAVAAAHAAERAGSWREAAGEWRQALRLHELAGTRATGSAVELLAPAITAHARAGDVVRARRLLVGAHDQTAQARRALVGAHDQSTQPRHPVVGAHDQTAQARRPLVGSEDLAVLVAWDAPLIWTTRDGREPSHSTVAAIRRHLASEIDEPSRVRLLVALFRELEGFDEAEAQRVSAEAVALARRVGEPRLLCAALNVRAYAALGPDLRDERRAVAEEYLAVAAAAGEIDHEAVAHWLLYLDAAAQTDLVRARAEMELAVARSTTGQLGSLLAVVGIFTALLEMLAGRVEESLRRYDEVSRRMAEHGDVSGASMGTVGRIGAAVARDSWAPLLGELRAIEAAYPGRVTDPLALALLESGAPEEARRVWAGRQPIDRNYYWLGYTTLRAHTAARLGDEEAGRQLLADLLPFAGRIAGLDSGTLYAGPVDAALYALTGDDAYAKSAAALTERLRTPGSLTEHPRTPGSPAA
ncbi:BTAD domain-containing putative transcriptional regulator [Paractinoplanes ovalisporus]|uniref:BTAD domain-containing putative transcriptional regulator n=1 Tax=Paractinoplanes ovalisporus TaxID=2810368 RepID=UPI0027DCF445|nr:BTAD domain-containing putative transcriptional regulator [Actinoplanes ovalisporus]